MAIDYGKFVLKDNCQGYKQALKGAMSLIQNNLDICKDWSYLVGESRKALSKHFNGLLVSFLLIGAGFGEQAAHATPYDICADPGIQSALPYQINQRSVFTAHGERWFCVVTPPGYSYPGPDYPLLIVFHGGNGNPQVMMDNKGIIEFGFRSNNNNGYVMIFATGLPRDRCDFADLPCEHNSWGDDANIAFINDILDYSAGFNLDEDRIFLAGFSGGARLIYRAIAENDFSQPIKGVATVAGGIGAMSTEATEDGLTLVNLLAGDPVHAMIAQGGMDPILNFDGGLSNGENVMHVSFQFKVDLFRLLTENETDPGVNYTSPSIMSMPLPMSTVATHYTTGSHQVVAISDSNTRHIWPNRFSPLMFEFFDSL